ncbi:MAG: uroporphyrinogen-III C-methyltransferase [Ignisphaera sp.]
MGKVYIVGAGPGDPELITLKALRLIKEADVILYDRLVSPQLLSYAKESAIKIYVGKEPGESHKQQEINKMLVEFAKRGLTVVRLKNGDPMVFGRGAEECLYVAEHGICCEVVPGVSSFLAASAVSGVPLTARGYSSSFAVVTSHEDPAKGFRSVDLSRIASAVDVVVVLMGASRAYEVLEEIGKIMGYDTHGVIAINVTLPGQTIIRGSLRDLINMVREKGVERPAVIIVGKSAKLSEKLYSVCR